MMKKIAIFTEGQTEQLFIEKLVHEIAGENKVVIQKEKFSSNRAGKREFIIIEAVSDILDQEYFVLIRDCCMDDTVKTAIIDSCENLAAADYDRILGLRDVYPKDFQDIPKLKRHNLHGVPTKFLPISIILAVMEVEAWFLAESKHFLKIHGNLTCDRIESELGYDPSKIDVQTRRHPAEDLNDIYRLEGRAYKKDKKRVQRTVNALDYEELYLNHRNNVSSLAEFIDEIDDFFS